MAEWYHLYPNVAPAWAEQWKEKIAPIIERLDGRVTLQEIEEAVQDGRLEVHATIGEADTLETVIITKVREYRSGLRVLAIDYMAGKMEEFMPDFHQLEALAREHRCHRIQVEGRPGWARVLGEDWTEVSRLISKEVNYG